MVRRHAICFLRPCHNSICTVFPFFCIAKSICAKFFVIVPRAPFTETVRAFVVRVTLEGIVIWVAVLIAFILLEGGRVDGARWTVRWREDGGGRGGGE